MRAFTRFHPLNRGVIAVLIGLLGLGPFLHGHVGASHVSGFHVDGLHAMAHTTDQGPSDSMSAVDDESPALGVTTSLPKSDDDGSLPAHAALLLAALLCLLLPRLPLARIRPYATDPSAARAYRDGWPPPALAPPRP